MSESTKQNTIPHKSGLIKFIEKLIFGAKWFLLPFYIVLICALVTYTYFDVRELIEYLHKLKEINKEAAMLMFIELIDMAMIANLGKMIITGSYNSFISKDHGRPGENISSGMLKVKMATSLVGVTAIHLLSKSIHIETVSWDLLYKIAFVHGVFLASAVVLELVEYLHSKEEKSH